MDNLHKTPPQELDFEKAVLGSLLIDKKAILEVMDILEPQYFYKEAHQLIFKAIKTLYNTYIDIDILTVANRLKKDNKLEAIGGDYYLVELSQKVSSSAHIVVHARIIQEHYIRREIISKFSELSTKAYERDKDIFNLIDESYNTINNVSKITETQSTWDFAEIVNQNIVKAIDVHKGDIPIGIKTPINQLNEVIGGWVDGNLIIVAARPGMGKTSFVLAQATYSAKNDIPVGFFSLEMSKEELTNKVISMECRIPSEKLRKHGLSPNEIAQYQSQLEDIKKSKLYIDDTASLNINQLRVKAKKMVSEHGVKLIIVDYLQLMNGSNNTSKQNREAQISEISRGLKMVAKELNVPVIALSQLSRAVESRGGNKRPLLSDLRESGAIEQDADIVTFIYRPEYYKIEYWDDEEQTPCKGQAELIISKNRSGALRNVRMAFVGKYTLFENLTSSNQFPNTPTISTQDAFLNDSFNDMPF